MKKFRDSLAKLNKGKFKDLITTFTPNLHYITINKIYKKAAKKFKSSAVLTAPIRARVSKDIELVSKRW